MANECRSRCAEETPADDVGDTGYTGPLKDRDYLHYTDVEKLYTMQKNIVLFYQRNSSSV